VYERAKFFGLRNARVGWETPTLPSSLLFLWDQKTAARQPPPLFPFSLVCVIAHPSLLFPTEDPMSSSSPKSGSSPSCEQADKRHTKRLVDSETDSSSPPPHSKRPRTTPKEEEETTISKNADERKESNPKDALSSTTTTEQQPLLLSDIAETLGYKAGDRLEVEWDICDDSTGEVVSRWWGATLQKHDGRTTEDGAVLRVLDYDPYPEGGFPHRSLEDVVFVHDGLLLNSERAPLSFRPEENIALNEEDLRQELNGMLMQLLKKHETRWHQMDAAQQAHMAERIAQGKEKIIHAILERWEKEQTVISAADIPAILEDAFHLE